MTEHHVVVAVAAYRSRTDATQDIETVAGANRTAAHDFVAATLVEKGADGQLTVGEHTSTTTDIGWHGLLLGAAVTAITAPLGILILTRTVSTPAAWIGAATLVAHFWQNTPKQQLRTMSDLLEARQAAVVIVALDHAEHDLGGLVSDAAIAVVAARTSADLDAEYSEAIADPG
jgi:hypothetical protein